MKSFSPTVSLFNLYVMFNYWSSWSSSHLYFPLVVEIEDQLEYFGYLIVRSNNFFQVHFYHVSLSWQIIAMPIK